VLEEDGSLRHAHQSLVTAPGVAPSVPVLRDLQVALSSDNGTVVHWWDHEKTVLRELQEQLESSSEPDREPLSQFITTLIGDDSAPGRLSDLGKLVLNTTFLQGTNGSSSIKKVLPAVLDQSDHLRSQYGQPIYGTPEMPSLNFPTRWTWLVEEEGKTLDPYSLLSPLLSDPEIQSVVLDAEDEETGNQEFIANGGAAMVAYSLLQASNIPAEERRNVESQLKRYCELDTLAMVMVYQGLKDWIR